LFEVVVCDGHTGNIALKCMEGAVDITQHLFRKSLKKGVVGYFLRIARLLKLYSREKLVSDEYIGGAPLLGLEKLVVIVHGSSSARALENALYYTKRNKDLIASINYGIKEKIAYCNHST